MSRADGHAVVAGVISVALLAACGVDDVVAGDAAGDGVAYPAADMSPDPAVELTAELTWASFDRAQGTIRVLLTNEGTEPIQIDSVQLDAPPYSMEPAEMNRSVIDPEQQTAFRVVHGAPGCDGLTDALAPPTVEVEVDGQQIQLGVGDSAGIIERLLTSHCAQQHVAEVASVGLGDHWTFNDDGSELTGTLVLERTGAGPAVSVVAVRGSVIFGLHPVDEPEAGSPLVVLEPEQDLVELPLMVKPARCDPHALADSKNTYTLRAWLALDDEPEVYTEFLVDTALRPTLDELCR